MKQTTLALFCLLLVLGSFVPISAETEEELMTCIQGEQSQRHVSSVIAGLQAELTKVTVPQIRQTVASSNDVRFYVKCIVDEGSCDRLGKALQSFLKDSRGGCRGCRQCERERVKYVLRNVYCKHNSNVKTINDYLNYDVFITYLGSPVRC
ncbi:hypothetical protein SK128_014481 [Halocaridina rubra]|uniref:Uncharacterized protein n=1 Tax=Halocaridina rubra TaxID=373956 RepID=A0AAN9A046_HALRR